jgi:hypothetical protein
MAPESAEPSGEKPRDDYDSPWKEILALRFPDFMAFFFPEIARQIDWTRGYETLDKELRQISRESHVGFRLADNLFKVWKKDGIEAWVLAHVEVQGRKETEFGERVFVYHTRIRDLYKRPVVSLAVLADDNPHWHISEYRESLWGCRTTFEFPAVKLLDYRDRWAELESSGNPFAVVVMAHLRNRETRKDVASRFQFKLRLSKSLYRRGWSKQEIVNLYRFIDWIMALPKELETAFHQELAKYEREVNMPYVTTAERIGIEKGLKEGKTAGKKEQGLATAKYLISLGILSEEQISAASDLSLEEIQEVKKNLERGEEPVDRKDC